MLNPTDESTLSPEYDPDTGTYRVEFDPIERQPSIVVVQAVAAVTETDALELVGLNESLDPEYLDRLFAPKQDGTPREGGHVTFPFAGHEVTVHSDGMIVLDPRQT